MSIKDELEEWFNFLVREPNEDYINDTDEETLLMCAILVFLFVGMIAPFILKPLMATYLINRFLYLKFKDSFFEEHEEDNS